MSAVRGTFSDFKTVKTRGVCQLIVEVPIESADHALQVLGGVPQAKAEQWVGIAPISAPEIADDETPKPERPKGGPICKRAALKCKEPSFQTFIRSRLPALYASAYTTNNVDSEDTCSQVVRRYCKVHSRSALDHDERAAQRWQELEDAYRQSQRGEGDDDLRRQANR